MKDRIKTFMDSRRLSAAELADSLGVQRSNISHILSGRNFPGAAFIEKFLLTFPELDARWLITGEGEMLIPRSVPQSQPGNSPDNFVQPPVRGSHQQRVDRAENTNARIIERIIIFYNDKTFTEYNPSG